MKANNPPEEQRVLELLESFDFAQPLEPLERDSPLDVVGRLEPFRLLEPLGSERWLLRPHGRRTPTGRRKR